MPLSRLPSNQLRHFVRMTKEHELPGVARRMSTPTITFIFGRKPAV